MMTRPFNFILCFFAQEIHEFLNLAHPMVCRIPWYVAYGSGIFHFIIIVAGDSVDLVEAVVQQAGVRQVPYPTENLFLQ
jgi:hypothetical protein